MKGPQTLGSFTDRKRRGVKIVMLTAYDAPTARLAQAGGVDAVLVGDSLGMVVLGYATTLPVTIDEMVHHCRAVAGAGLDVPVIVDMPYGSFHVSPAAAVRDALRLVKEGGAVAVKIEGGRKRGPVIEALLGAEIPVMGHLGLTPQSVNRLGGWKVQGRGRGAADLLADEALFLEEAGCFAIVLECIPATLGARISRALTIPVIGIGAGAGCDGQVLVFHDLLGLSEMRPTFAKRYAELGDVASEAIRRWAEDVRSGAFPGQEHEFSDAATPAASGGAAPPDSQLRAPRAASAREAAKSRPRARGRKG